MFRLARANLRAGTAALIPAGISLMLASALLTVAMLATPLISTAALRMYSLDYGQANVVVESFTSPLTQETVDELADLPLVSAAAADITGTIGIQDGQSVSYEVFVPAQEAEFARYSVIEGFDPVQSGEIAMTQARAEKYGVSIGDQVTLALPISAGAPINAELASHDALHCEANTCQLRPTATLTAIIQSPPTVLGDRDRVVLPSDDIALFYRVGAIPQQVDRLLISSPDPQTLVATITDDYSGDVMAQTVASAAEARLNYTTGQIALLPAIVLVFAALSLVIAALVVANTFQVLIAQRIKMLALLRCVGARRSQLRGSVVIEAAILGVVSAVAGVLLGYGLIATALAYLANLPTVTSFDMSLPVTLAAFTVPIGVTILMSILACAWPAIVASQVPPLQALAMPDLPVDRHPASWRTHIGIGLVVGGVGGMGTSLLIQPWLAPVAEAFPVMQVGLILACIFIATTIAGLAVLMPRMIPWLTDHITRFIALLSPRSRRAGIGLTRLSIMRHPARVGAATMALFLTTALVTLTAGGSALSRSSINATLNERFQFDLQISAYEEHGETAASFLRAHVSSIPGVRDVAIGHVAELALAYGPDEQRTALNAAGVNPTELALTAHDASLAPALTDNVIVVSDDFGIPESVTEVKVWAIPPASGDESGDGIYGEVPSDADPLGVGPPPADAQTFRVIHTAAYSPALLTRSSLDSLHPQATSLIAAAALDPAMAKKATDTARSTFAPMTSSTQYNLEGSQIVRTAIDDAFSVLFAVIIGLLAIAVLISFVGVANTMILSAVERRREVALLRAVGMTVAQLRNSLAVEGLLISLMGTVLGIVGGSIISIVGAALVLTQEHIPLTFDFPWQTIGILLALAVPAGVASSIVPAHTILRDFNVEDLAS